ncbi:hypothetical protein AO356_26545 [Pseudomonas fluorescens]|uniref:Metallo-beta-lactamase domain-containing protein n=2 Tax=Pseudomonas TaxID=286 RepID=A0A0N9WD21_PSEFL|nr:hypothetical protein AO356_26545 [Pseudomonas fluorescens]
MDRSGMIALAPSVFRVQPSKVTPTKYCSFFVVHPQGNLMLPCFAKGASIEGDFEAMANMGGVSAQLLGDMHLKSNHCDVLHKRFGAWTYCSEPERDDVGKSVGSVKAFPFHRHHLFPHVEVIPTPGHRPGGTCFLVEMDGFRALFAGDNVGYDGANWTAFPSKSGKEALRQSLSVLADCEFDVLYAITLAVEPVCSISLPTAEARQCFFNDVAVQAGLV